MSTPEIKEDNVAARQSKLVKGEIQIPPRSSSLPFRQISAKIPHSPSKYQGLENTSTDQTTGNVAEIGQTEDEFNIVIHDEQTRIRHLKLYGAALSGDWNTAASIYAVHPEDISAKITKQMDTALHVAAAANNTAFVRKLVKRMTEEDLAKVNIVGNTAFHYAASSGDLEIAMVMIQKNPRLATIRRADGLLPIHVAAQSGHEGMAFLLYNETKTDGLNDVDRIELLVASINTDSYDFALTLFTEHEELALSRDRNKETALHALSQKYRTSSNLTERLFNFLSRPKFDHNMWQSFLSTILVERIWDNVILNMGDQQISELIETPWPLIFVAAEKGNFEFLRVLIRDYPDIIWNANDDGHTIFHIAVLNRQEKIFRLIYEIGSRKDSIVSFKDKDGNSILHLAGMLPPINRLNVEPGAALQMQREIIWFKEVRRIVRPSDAEAENKKKKTPLDLFVESHKTLKTEGEMWMKDTANSCMVVATLVTTVVFAAAFTIPGGTKGDTGAPNFGGEVSFKIFVISDAISLVFSSISILCFLSILTSISSEEDFLWRLHKSLLLGFASLFMSIAAMMVVFCTTCFIIFNGETLWIPILVTALASIPVLLFIRQHYRVFVTLARSATLQSLY